MSNEKNNIVGSRQSEKNEESNAFTINIMELLSVVLSKLWILVLVGLIASVGAYFYTTKLCKPTYVSTASVYILNRQNSLATSMNDLNSAASMKEDFQVLIQSSEVFREVLRTVGEDPGNYKTLRGKVSLDNNMTRFVKISVADTDPVRAKVLVDAFVNVSRVKAKAIMGVEDVTIDYYGEIPTVPSGPNLQRNIILAAFAGIFLSAVIIAVVHILNDRVRSVEVLERTLGVSVLGTIPDVSTIRRPKSRKSKRKKPSQEKSNN